MRVYTLKNIQLKKMRVISSIKRIHHHVRGMKRTRCL